MSNKFEEKEFHDSFNIGIWKKIAKLFHNQFKYLMLVFLFQVLLAVSDTLIPILNRMAIDNFTNSLVDNKTVIYYILFYLFIILITAFFVYLYFIYTGKVEMGFAYDLREKCFKKLHELSFSYYDVTPTGWIMARVTSDISRLAEVLAYSVSEIAWGLPMMIFMTIIMLKINVKLTLLVLVVIPPIIIISIYAQYKLLKTYRKVRRANSKVTNDFSEAINGAKTIKTLYLDEYNFNEFKIDTDNMKKVSIHATNLGSFYRPLVNLISSLAISFIIWYGADLASNNLLSFGTLVLFVQYATSFYEPVRMLAIILSDFQLAQASAERIIHLLESDISVKDDANITQKYGTVFDPKYDTFDDIKGNIVFENVSFSYVQNEMVLDNFNLEVKKGETVALVGETGSGKSTIVNLICRFYEPISGRILIDGIDIRDRSLSWLHSKLGYVLQAPHLFSGTIMDNVRYGRLDASDEEVIEVCKMINADEFINKLEKGYFTDVGEGGSRLSTGQKQLISFARAILVNPQIFILDEATSSIDTETEKVIQYAIDNIMKDKTSFVVAHRLSTIVNADKILVINKGKIIESGTHDELMTLKGKYYELYTTQFNETVSSTSFDNI